MVEKVETSAINDPKSYSHDLLRNWLEQIPLTASCIELTLSG